MTAIYIVVTWEWAHILIKHNQINGKSKRSKVWFECAIYHTYECFWTCVIVCMGACTCDSMTLLKGPV